MCDTKSCVFGLESFVRIACRKVISGRETRNSALILIIYAPSSFSTPAGKRAHQKRSNIGPLNNYISKKNYNIFALTKKNQRLLSSLSPSQKQITYHVLLKSRNVMKSVFLFSCGILRIPVSQYPVSHLQSEDIRLLYEMEFSCGRFFK